MAVRFPQTAQPAGRFAGVQKGIELAGALQQKRQQSQLELLRTLIGAGAEPTGGIPGWKLPSQIRTENLDKALRVVGKGAPSKRGESLELKGITISGEGKISTRYGVPPAPSWGQQQEIESIRQGLNRGEVVIGSQWGEPSVYKVTSLEEALRAIGDAGLDPSIFANELQFYQNIVRTGVLNGRKVAELRDGSVVYIDTREPIGKKGMVSPTQKIPTLRGF